jgi:hypothetical protein
MMKRALIVCILVSCIAALHAESKVVTYPLPLQPNEEVVRLSGNPDFYTAVTKLTIKGIVPKVEYWVVTSAGRTGPFYDVPTTSADVYPHIRSFFATYEEAGTKYIVYGPNKPGTTMGSIAELGSIYELLNNPRRGGILKVSNDGRRWAAVVNSRLKPEAFDILTDKGVLDWYSDPALVGFTADNTLLYWTTTEKVNDFTRIFSFWREKIKLFSKQFKYSYPSTELFPVSYISITGKEWGWAEYEFDLYKPGKTTTFNVIFEGGKKKIKINSCSEILFISPDGQVLHSPCGDGCQGLHLDGVYTGMDQLLAVSPDRKRVAIQAGERIIVDGQDFFDLSDHTGPFNCFFSADSEHFIIQGYSIDDKKIPRPNEERLAKISKRLNLNVHHETIINERTLGYVTLVRGPMGWIVDYFTSDLDTDLNEARIELFSQHGTEELRFSDDGKVVAFLSYAGELVVNGEEKFQPYGKIDEYKEVHNGIESMSPDGSEISFLRKYGIFSVDKLYPGNFFGKDPVKYPEGSIKYKDGAVVVTTW